MSSSRESTPLTVAIINHAETLKAKADLLRSMEASTVSSQQVERTAAALDAAHRTIVDFQSTLQERDTMVLQLHGACL
jgi:hypothetical protein